jgi:hypothetical protein
MNGQEVGENLCLEVLTNMSREVEGPFEPGLYGLTFSHIIFYAITFILKGSCMFALVMIFAAASRASFKICPSSTVRILQFCIIHWPSHMTDSIFSVRMQYTILAILQKKDLRESIALNSTQMLLILLISIMTNSC